MIKNPQRSILLQRMYGNKSLLHLTETCLFADSGSIHFPESFPTSPFLTSALPSPFLPPAPFSEERIGFWKSTAAASCGLHHSYSVGKTWIPVWWKTVIIWFGVATSSPMTVVQRDITGIPLKTSKGNTGFTQGLHTKGQTTLTPFSFSPKSSSQFYGQTPLYPAIFCTVHYRQPAHKYVWNRQPPIGNLLQQRLDLLIPWDPFQPLWFCDSMECTSCWQILELLFTSLKRVRN